MAELFNVTHDANNLLKYDATVVDGGDLSTGAPGLAGTTAKMEALVDDTTAIYGYMDVGAGGVARARVRIYIDPNSIAQTDSGDYLLFVTIMDAAGAVQVFRLYLVGDGADYQIWLYADEDTGAVLCASTAGLSDTVHYIEIDCMAASGVGADDGFGKLWIDGNYIDGKTDLDNDVSAADMRYFMAGARDIVDTSGTLYLDEFIANDDGGEIGPVVVGVVGAMMRLGVGGVGG